MRMQSRSSPLASSSLDPSVQGRWGGVNASSPASAHSTHDSSKAHHCCCNCSPPLERIIYQIIELLVVECNHNIQVFFLRDCRRLPSGNFLLLTVADLDFLLLMEDPRLLIPLMTDMVSSSPPAWREFLYEMRGSQQSSLCRAIWNVMNLSRYKWLSEWQQSQLKAFHSQSIPCWNQINTFHKQLHIFCVNLHCFFVLSK